MTPDLFLRYVDGGLSLLPRAMDSAEARAQLLAIAFQETRLLHRRQLFNGPARSYYQFEMAGIAGVLNHRASRAHAQRVCERLDVDPTVQNVYQAIEYNDHLATGFARLLLWTSPARLPGADEPERAWNEYIYGWRPGKPHRKTWNGHFTLAWSIVRGEVMPLRSV